MVTHTPIHISQFSNRYWKTAQEFRTFSSLSICPLGANEAPQAALHLPLAFIKRQDTFDLVALVGLKEDDNLGVDVQTGKWLLDYLPIIWRTYPFKLANYQDYMVMVADQTSGLISNDSIGHFPFFTASGMPSKPFQLLIDELTRLHEGRMGAFSLCKAIEDAGILEPWKIVVQEQEEQELIHINGLYRISEKALSSLGNVPFLSLRQNGALALAYSQLLSMGNIHKLARLAYQRYQVADFEPDKNIGFDSDTISFS